MSSPESPTPSSRASCPRRLVAWATVGWFLASLALAWLGNGSHSLWDRDEPRYAEATREMIAGGDWMVPHFNGRDRFDKPILIYWLLSLPMRWLGPTEFAARAVAGMAGAAVVAGIFLLARRMGAGMAGANVAALLAMVCPLLLVIAKAATTDAVLVLTVVGALGIHWEQTSRGFSWARHAAFWIVIGLSALGKGPIGPLIVGLAVACERLWGIRIAKATRTETGEHQAAKRPWVPVVRVATGILLFAAVTLPWAWGAWSATRGEFFRVAIGRHVIERAATSLESHRGPFVYYLPVALAGTFPMTAVVLAALRWGWRERRRPALQLLWCWIVPGLVMFSLARTKLPHYIAPLAPAACVMAGLFWSAWRGERTSAGAVSGDAAQAAASSPLTPGLERRSGMLPAGPAAGWFLAGSLLTMLMGFAAAAALPFATVQGPFPMILAPSLVIGVTLAVTSVGGGVLWWRRDGERAVAMWAGGFVLSVVVGMLWALPKLEPLRPAKPLVAWVRANAPPGTELLAVDYQEPSLVFYWQDRVDMIGKGEREEGLARLQDVARPAALITTESVWNRWLDHYKSLVAGPVSVRYQKRFYLFQKGRWERLVVVGNWE